MRVRAAAASSRAELNDTLLSRVYICFVQVLKKQKWKLLI